MPAMPIAESRPPIVVGIRHTSSATRTIDRLLGVGEHRERLQRHGREQEDDREPGQQDVERDLVRRLLPRGALDERDHPVEERLARARGDAHDDLVGEHARAAGDRRAVAAGLADHRCRLAGDRRLVDAGDALDHLAVARDDLARGHDDHVVDRRARCSRTSSSVPSGARRCAMVSGAGRAQRVGLGLAAPLGDRLGEVGEEHGEPQERRDEPGEHVLLGRARSRGP